MYLLNLSYSFHTHCTDSALKNPRQIWKLMTNPWKDLFIIFRTKHSTEVLMCLVRNSMNKMLEHLQDKEIDFITLLRNTSQTQFFLVTTEEYFSATFGSNISDFFDLWDNADWVSIVLGQNHHFYLATLFLIFLHCSELSTAVWWVLQQLYSLHQSV